MASTAPALQRIAAVSERRSLRRIPALHTLSQGDLEDVQERMFYRAYQAGDVLCQVMEGPFAARARQGYLVAVSGDSVGGRPAVGVTHRPAGGSGMKSGK